MRSSRNSSVLGVLAVALVVEVNQSFSDYPDLVTELGVRTDGEVCISWVR